MKDLGIEYIVFRDPMFSMRLPRDNRDAGKSSAGVLKCETRRDWLDEKDAEVGTLKRGSQTVLGDRELHSRMAADGPRRAAAYDWTIVTRRYLELMLPLVAARRSAA